MPFLDLLDFLYFPSSSPSPSDNPPYPLSSSSTTTPASSYLSIYSLFSPSRLRPDPPTNIISMNLRIVPAVSTAPTVIFSLNWHNLPASLPLPSFYANQLAACHDANVPTPRNTLALDKAVGLHLLLESVTFDLARGLVSVAWLDKRSQEWAIDTTRGLQAALEDVLDCVRNSGEEADKEKKAAVAQAKQAQAQAALGHSHSTSVTSTADTTSTASSSASPAMGHKRHRTASGIFSSLVASFVSPQSSPDPNAPAQLYRSRRSGSTASSTKSSVVPLIHRQHVAHPLNKRDSFPTNPVPQSRFLRRQARAKLVDVFRFYVAGRLVNEMRSAGIVGQELRERGILDDMDDDEEIAGTLPGTSGYAAAGGYVAHSARSMLRTALAEAKSDDSLSSSSEDSLLLTPPNNSDTSLPTTDDGKSTKAQRRPAATATPSSPRRRAPTPSPQARQIRQLSSLLIGLTQKDKRNCTEEREMLELVKDRSLRRRWSLSDATARSRMRCASDPQAWTRPVIPSPLRSSEVIEQEVEAVTINVSSELVITLPFPSDATSSSPAVPFPIDSNSAVVSPPPVPRRTRSLPAPPPSANEEDVMEDAQSEVVSKASEAEDVLSSSRPRRSAILSAAPATTPIVVVRAPLTPIQTHASGHQQSEDSDLIAIRSLPGLPSPKYTEFDENAMASRRSPFSQSFPEDVSDVSDEDEDMMDESDEDDAAARVSPPPQYAPALPVDQAFRDAKDVKVAVRGLELDTSDKQAGTAYWSPASDGIYVV